MNYIYDIVLNFNEVLHSFYEWNLDDEIIHIRKIPFIKVNEETFYNIKNSKFKIDKTFLEKIEGKTDIFNKVRKDKILHACIFTNGLEAFAESFDSNGVSLKKSSLLIDEEEEVAEVALRVNNINLSFEILEKDNGNIYQTRKEREILNYVRKELQKLDRQNDVDKLEYLAVECLNKKIKDKNNIINSLNKELNNNFDEIGPKLYNFFQLISIKHE